MRKVEIAVYTLPELKDVNKEGYEKALELMAEWNTLADEYECRVSEECALETAEANEYEFYKNGRMFSDNDL